MRRCLSAFALLLLAVSCRPPDLEMNEFPPQVLERFSDMPLDGGRVQSIAVNPLNRSDIIIACQWGGLWKTVDGTPHWFPLDGLPALFAIDVAFAPDGLTVIATTARDNRVVNGGGIWVSRDGGYSWFKPATATPPVGGRILERIGGAEISFAPDIRGRVYAGTDYGVAISDDNGASWTHTILDPATSVDDDRMQDLALSVLALPGDRALATSRRGVYMKNPGVRTWTQIRAGYFANGFKMMDVSPLDADKVFILQDYNTLFLFEVASSSWTTLALPGGVSRAPFVRVSRSNAGPDAIDIWYGAGTVLRRATRTGIAAIRSTAPGDWISMGRSNGLHDDSGHLGLDHDARPVLYGSDGGVFRPTNADATSWTRASTGRGGLNSYQITSLAGTVSTAGAAPQTSLYFATQDNGLWSSADEGVTWPFNDCAEGFHIRVRPHIAAGDDITVGYGKIGCAPSSSMFSNANFIGSRAVPDDLTGGGTVDSASQAFLIRPGYWARYRPPVTGDPEIYVSDDNGLHWRKRAVLPMQSAGVFQPSIPRQRFRLGRPPRASLYLPFYDTRIGLIHLPDALASGVRTLTAGELIRLPDNGSLGVRATEFDWQAVFAVDPNDPRFIIAPDANNGVVKVTRDGGATWATDVELTRAVTENGSLMMYDGDAWHLQVTHIAFDPRDSNRILVGTRDAGSFVSIDHGISWWKIANSERAHYVTGFFFKDTYLVYAATYGRGLWKIEPTRLRIPPFEKFCVEPCMFRDPRKRIPLEHPDWLQDDVILFVNGEVNGMTGRDITVTPGTSFVRYGSPRRAADVSIVVSAEGSGFRDIAGQKVVGVAFRGGKLAGLITSAKTLSPQPNEPAPKPAAIRPPAAATTAQAPYLFVTTELPMTGLPVLGSNGIVHLRATGFAPAREGVPQPDVMIDGMRSDSKQAYVDEKGVFVADIKVPDQLPYGVHRIEVVQKTPRAALRAFSQFVKAAIDDFEAH